MNLHDLKIFGCRAYPNFCGLQKHKFGDRFESHVFFEYLRDFDEYARFHLIMGKIVISKNVAFLEDDFDQNLGLWLQSSTISIISQLDEGQEIREITILQ